MSETHRRAQSNLRYMYARRLLAQNRHNTVQIYAHDRSQASIFC